MCHTDYLDPAAVISFFRITGKKHLFITGNRGSGKTYLANAVLPPSFSFLRSCKTQDNRVVISSNLVEKGKEFVIGVPIANGENLPDAVNRMSAVEDGFLNCAIPAVNEHLKSFPNKVFFIDELGYLESTCIPYKQALDRLLAQSSVIAVLRKQSTEFLDRLKKREDALVIDIDNTFDTLTCLVMASGMSKRFGSNKLLADFNGHTLFENAVCISRFVKFGKTLAVTRTPDIARLCVREHIPVLKHDCPLRNEMIHLSVSRILDHHTPDGILFLPSDQPLISQYSLQLLCLTFLYHIDKICRLSYDGIGGSPVIFSKKFYDELLSLPKGKGGSFLAEKYPAQVILVPAREQYELSDIDTPFDLAGLLP